MIVKTLKLALENTISNLGSKTINEVFVIEDIEEVNK